MTLSSLAVFALTLLVAAWSPGPSVAALVSRVLTHGVRDVLPFLAALWFGEILWLTAAVAGLAALAKTYAALFVVIKYAGVAYLLFLAWSMWFAPTETSGEALPEGRRPWRMVAGGLMVSIGNAKNMVFYMALLPTVVDLDRIGLAGWAQLCATALLVLALVDVGWAVAASRARVLLRSRRAVKIANRTSASMMAGAAVAIAAR